MLIRVADYVALRCAQDGISEVFMVTGGGAMHLNDAFSRNESLNVYCFHHEQGAAIAAEGYARLNNKPALVNVTTGPGGINALNGVYGAYVDSIPMLVVSGQVKSETYAKFFDIPLRQLGDQEVDIVSMAMPVVKYAKTLANALEIGDVLDKALYLMKHGRPGPVWIDIPIDFQGALIDADTLPRSSDLKGELLADPGISDNTRLELTNLNSTVIKSEIDLVLIGLRKSKRPVIFAGTGLRISGMSKEFLEIVEILKIPVVTGWNAHDLISADNAYFAGKPGTVGDRSGNFCIQNADFILILGCRLNIRQISYAWCNFAPRAFKVMVDVDYAELNKPTLKIDLKIHACLKSFIPELKKIIIDIEPNYKHKEFSEWCKARVKKYDVLNEIKSTITEKVNPYKFMRRLFEILPENSVAVAGNGSACVIGFQASNLKKEQRFFTNSGSASMGYDIPASIGASIATNFGRIICLAGDGSVMMNIQELQTISYYKLPVKVIILNNNGYHSIRQTQKNYFPDNFIGTCSSDGVSFPNFQSLGAAFGFLTMKLINIDAMESQEFRNALDSLDPYIIEVVLDESQEFSPKLASKKSPDGSMQSPSLENMAPFLSDEEMLANKLS